MGWKNTTHEINNTQDVIDSRDVIARIDTLEDEVLACVNCSGESQTCETCEDERAELKTLKDLAEEASGYADDWHHGETLIRDSYFETYARELAEDIGAIDHDAKWPNTCIDWEQAAKELQQDYTSVDFDGTDYWIR